MFAAAERRSFGSFSRAWRAKFNLASFEGVPCCVVEENVARGREGGVVENYRFAYQIRYLRKNME